MAAETVFDELEDMKKQAQKKAADQNLAAAKTTLRGIITQTETELRGKAREKRTVDPNEVKNLKPGDEVQLLNVSGVTATVLKAPDADGNVQVQAGIMKMNVRVTEVRPLKKQKPDKKPSGRPAGGKGGVRELRVAAAPSEIDVRGLCAEEAILEVDQFISSALMSKLPTVRIIHGKGTGAVRKAVREHLKRSRYVKSFRPGRYGEGEDGVTIAELR